MLRCSNCGYEFEQGDIAVKMTLERLDCNPECEVWSTETIYLSGESRWCLDCVKRYNI